MSFIGKILVVLIVIMSVVFMVLAVTVYSSHQNWYTEAQSLQTQLDQARVEVQQANDRHNRLESRLTGELEATRQEVRRLESERTRLVDQNAALREAQDELRQQSSDRIAAVAATQENNNRLMNEVTNQRGIIRSNQQARDRGFATMLQATEARDQLQGELAILRDQNRALTRQNASMAKVMRSEGLDPQTDPDYAMEPTDGIVSAIRRRGATHLIEVTIGSDDGLQTGHTVEVFRGARYLGRAEIIYTSPDRAIGKLDRSFLQGQVQEGDRVATRLKLS